MNSYNHDWETFRAHKRRIVVCMFAEFFGFFPFLLLVATIDRKLFSTTSLVPLAAFIWAALYLFTLFRLRSFPCPRCKKNFFGGFFGSLSTLSTPAAFFGRQCVHCGLRKYAAESSQEEDLKDATSAKQLNGTVRNLIAGAAGALTYFVLPMLFPSPSRRSVLQPNIDPDTPGIIGMQYRLLHLLNASYVILPVFLVWIYLAISRRDERKSWIYAFLSGYSLPFIILYWVLKWI
jgi:hypothetical protein